MSIKAVAEHVRKHLILYTVLTILLALPIGYYCKAWIAHNKELVSNLIVIMAILTIFPSAIQLKIEGFMKNLKDWKSMIIFLLYVYVLAPVIAMALAPALGDPLVGIGFVTTNAVPASSASLGYVFIAGGSVELATALIIISTIIGIPAMPLIIKTYANIASVPVPIEAIIISLTEVLVAPLVVGQIIRYIILKKKDRKYVNEDLKPLLSLWTMLTLLVLIFLLIFSQAAKVISNPLVAVKIIGYQIAVMIVVLGVSLAISRALHIKYENHQAIVILSITKNASIAAGIMASALGPQAAVAPALIPTIQPVVVIAYLNAENWVRKFLR